MRTGQVMAYWEGQPFRKQFLSPGLYATALQPGAVSHAIRHCVRLSMGALLPTPGCRCMRRHSVSPHAI